MPAEEHLSGLQFKYGTWDEGGSTPVHQLRASHQVPYGEGKSVDVHVGSLTWSAKGIRSVDVVPEHQRQGIGTAMWNEGHRLASEHAKIPQPKHSGDRTDAGDAWARRVGGRLPRRK